MQLPDVSPWTQRLAQEWSQSPYGAKWFATKRGVPRKRKRLAAVAIPLRG